MSPFQRRGIKSWFGSGSWIQHYQGFVLALSSLITIHRAVKRGDCGCISTDTFTLSLMTNWKTAMTGKLAEKLPLTMSSLINTIPDSLYPEEDIPTSMNIFTNTDSISHYSQMNTGKDQTLLISQSYGFIFFGCRAVCVVLSTIERQQLSLSSARFSGTCFAHFYALYKRSYETYLFCDKSTSSLLRKHWKIIINTCCQVCAIEWYKTQLLFNAYDGFHTASLDRQRMTTWM